METRLIVLNPFLKKKKKIKKKWKAFGVEKGSCSGGETVKCFTLRGVTAVDGK